MLLLQTRHLRFYLYGVATQLLERPDENMLITVVDEAFALLSLENNMEEEKSNKEKE